VEQEGSEQGLRKKSAVWPRRREAAGERPRKKRRRRGLRARFEAEGGPAQALAGHSRSSQARFVGVRLRRVCASRGATGRARASSRGSQGSKMFPYPFRARHDGEKHGATRRDTALSDEEPATTPPPPPPTPFWRFSDGRSRGEGFQSVPEGPAQHHDPRSNGRGDRPGRRPGPRGGPPGFDEQRRPCTRESPR